MGSSDGDQNNVRRESCRLWLVVVSVVSLLAVTAAVPCWSVLLVWALTTEILATLLDTWEWLISTRSQRRGLAPRENDKSLSEPRDILQKFTWQELREHNTESSTWIAVHDKVYDVTYFIDRHPGGKELLLLAAGRDATDLFESYHPFTNKAEQVLKKFLIGELVTFEHPRFRKDSGFYRECKERVKAYFDKTGLNPKHPFTALWRMSLVYIVGFIAFWLTYTTQPMVIPLRILCAVVYGICQVIPLFHLMHDASHAAFGNSEKWWWYCGRITLDWLSGSSMVAWRNQHVIGHHIYTNVFGSDPDIPASLEGDPRRLLPQQVWRKLYRYQHIYLPLLYGILALKNRTEDVLEVFVKGLNGPIHVNPHSMQDILRQVGSKSFWLFTRIVVPYCFFGQPLCHSISLFFFTELVSGYWLAFNFQVTHISTESDFFVKQTVVGRSSIIDVEWAKLQVKASVDYGHGSAWDTFFSGAVNYHTTHHLFPTVSQYHYPQVAPIIKKVCRKYSLTYNVLPSYAAAVQAHYNHLKNMGREGKGVSLKLE